MTILYLFVNELLRYNNTNITTKISVATPLHYDFDETIPIHFNITLPYVTSCEKEFARKKKIKVKTSEGKINSGIFFYTFFFLCARYYQ